MNIKESVIVDSAGIGVPPEQNFNTEAFQGSMQQVLSENIGERVMIEFLIGTQLIQRKIGIIYSVATSYVVLYEDKLNEYVVCDIFSVKFVTFYPMGCMPQNRKERMNNLASSNTAKNNYCKK